MGKQINKIKEIITDPYSLGELIWRRIFSNIVYSDETYIRVRYYLQTRHQLNLTHPKTFTEKIQWLKLYNRKDFYPVLVDKYEAKRWVAKNCNEIKIIPTLGLWDKFEDIDFESLPMSFVLKCTHDSGGLVICKDKSSFDFKFAKNKISSSLNRNYYRWTREWPYKMVNPRIIAEEYMEEKGHDDLTDYKFFCFNGRAEYCQVISDRHNDETIDFYDRKWNHQPFIGLMPTSHHAPTPHHAPICYEKMLTIVDNLAKIINSPFVRVDLYLIDEEIYFGEITFFPRGGHGVFNPSVWNQILGDKITI